MTQEQILTNYAVNYKSEAKEAHNLTLSMKDKIIPGIQKKLDEFYKEQKHWNDLRYDRDYCMKTYIQQSIDGKIEY